MRVRLGALAVSGALLLAACGDTSPNAATDGQGTTTTSAASCPASSGLSGPITDHGAQAASGSELSVEADDSFFAPTCVTAVPEGTVQMVVHNSGQALHNVSIPDQHIDVDVAAGETITVSVELSGGAVPYFCKFHRTSGMVGSLISTG